MSKKRRQHSPALKAQVGLEALKNIDRVHAIAAKHGVHPTQVSQWKKEVAARLPELFSRAPDEAAQEAQARAKQRGQALSLNGDLSLRWQRPPRES